jgi:hypothetical protein
MTISLHPYIARQIADARSDADMSQADLEKEIAEILQNQGVLKILGDFVATNIAFYRKQNRLTLTTLASSIEFVEKKLRMLRIKSGVSFDRSKLSKAEQEDGRGCAAEELWVIALAVKKPLKSFFPPIPEKDFDCDPLTDYVLISQEDNIREYQHSLDRAKISVIFIDQSIKASHKDIATYL